MGAFNAIVAGVLALSAPLQVDNAAHDTAHAPPRTSDTALRPLLAPREADGARCIEGAQVCIFVITPADGPVASRSAPRLSIQIAGRTAEVVALESLPANTSENGHRVKLWDQVIPMRSAGGDASHGWIIGIIHEADLRTELGGLSSSHLHLYPVTLRDGQAALGNRLAILAWTGSRYRHMCENEWAIEDRLGACRDVFDFAGQLTLAPSAQVSEAGVPFPSLRFTSQATYHPRTARRHRATPRLRRSDLVRTRDRRCSYTRILRHNPAKLRYDPDRPVPFCPTYTVP